MTGLSGARGLLICVSGPSGVGKGTIIREVLRRRANMAHSISVTTRAPRPGEQHGVDYYFTDRQSFLRMLEAGEILEHDIYCDQYYGTPLKPLQKLVAAGTDVLLDITVPGSLAVMQNYPDCVTLCLLPPSLTELKNRLSKRGTETAEAMQKRLTKARDEVKMASSFQYVVVNDNLTETARQIQAIIDAEHCRYARLAGIEETILAH
ncbi:MAG: guanylate kinase [Clostridiaceae bacterium]|jgi:guanylate kinase|nr:guanylate kinase [Clostridiaceae bacterium]